MNEKLAQEWLETIAKQPEAATLVDILSMTDELIRSRKAMDGITTEVLRYEIKPLSHQNQN